VTFHSHHHPGGTSRATLAVRAQARPVALALIAVMTLGLAAALQGEAFLWPFVAATALAYLAAAAVGQSSLHRTIAEIELRGPFASVRSVWDAAGWRTDGLAPIVSARLVQGELSVGIGDTVMTLRREDWPDFDALTEALRAAAREAQTLGGWSLSDDAP
jgi:hypothetical protein